MDFKVGKELLGCPGVCSEDLLAGMEHEVEMSLRSPPAWSLSWKCFKERNKGSEINHNPVTFLHHEHQESGCLWQFMAPGS